MRCYLVIILLYSFTSFVQGQGSVSTFSNNSLDEFPFHITYFNAKQGLPQNQITAIIKNKRNMLLVGTTNGIVRFNGSKFVPTNIADEHKQYIYTRFGWDSKMQRLFGVSSSGKLFQLKPTFKEVKRGVADFFIENDTIYTIENDSILYCSDLSLHQTKQLLVAEGVLDIILKKGKKLFVGGKKGLVEYHLKTKQQEKIAAFKITAIKYDQINNLIIGLGASEIIAFDPEDTSIPKINTSLSGYYLTSNRLCQLNDVLFLDTTRYILTSTNGLFYYDGMNTHHFSSKDGLQGNSFSKILFEEEQNTLFIGSYVNGLIRLTPKLLKNFTIPDYYLEQSYRSVVQHRNEIYAIVSGGEVAKLKNNTLTKLPKFQSEFSYATMSSINDHLFLGTWGDGFYVYEDDKLIGHVNTSEKSTNSVLSIYKDDNNAFWVGTVGSILFGAHWNSLTPVSSIQDRISVFYSLRNGQTVAGGKSSVYFLNLNGELDFKIGEKEGLKAKEVRAFYEDTESGYLYIGTYGGGLYAYHLKNGTLFSFGKSKYTMFNDDIFTLAEDRFGKLLMTSNNGLYAINKKHLNAYLMGELDYIIPFNFGRESGIYNPEFNGGFQNNALTNDSIILFPTINGLISYFSFAPVEIKRKITLERVFLNDSLIKGDINRLPFKTHTLAFHFSSPSYNPIYNTHYQYKLTHNNGSSEWSKPQKENQISFQFLPPGEYQLQIRAIDASNKLAPKELLLHFSIAQPYYLTAWFRIIVIIAIVTTVTFLVYWRSNLLSRQKEQENKLNLQLLDLKLKAIQSKMNPHFLFNTLNTINYLVASEKYDEAEDYLEQFSSLLRKFLENSDKTFASIQSEVEMIENYLKIERKRFGDKLAYEMNVAPHLLHKKIPTLLIQPFVENSIKHGIGNSPKEGSVKITIFEKDNIIHIEVLDSGIGRKLAAQINEDREGHTSMGIRIVNDKIKVLKDKYKTVIGLEVYDLTEPQTGTRIIIKIPTND